MAAPRIAIFAEGPDWHARRLKDAFQRQGAEATCLALASCGVRTTGTGLHLPKYDKGAPDAAFVKTVAAGSFEQVTMRLGVLHALRDMGTMVVNDARAIERCVDKSMTSFLLHRHRIPTPQTWAVESRDEARKIVRGVARPGRPLVLKPLFGSQGRGLKLVEKLRDLPAAEEVQGVFYLQRYVTGPTAGWRDWRVFVVGGRAIAAMIRHGVQWRTNAAQGARCQGVPAAGEIADLAVAAARAVDADYAGVDIIQDRAGHHLVLEVNSMPAWRALQTATGIDIADALAAHVMARLESARRNCIEAIAGAVMASAGHVEQAYLDACLAELAALKPGNVHKYAAGHDMTVTDFETSARVTAPVMAASGLTIGRRIHEAIRRTRQAVANNTNLGIVLLCAPLAQAALEPSAASLRRRLEHVLTGLTVDDAEQAFAAITLASPGGLGTSDRHDVRDKPTVTLQAAMAEAHERDRIAAQYCSNFADIFGLGLGRLAEAEARWPEPEWRATAVYLGFLAAFPDSHIRRKFDDQTAQAVMVAAQQLERRLWESATPSSLLAELEKFDRSLKDKGINPGTSADLTVATLFVSNLG